MAQSSAQPPPPPPPPQQVVYVQAPPPAPPKKKHTLRNVVVVVFILIIIVIIVVAASSLNKPSTAANFNVTCGGASQKVSLGSGLITVMWNTDNDGSALLFVSNVSGAPGAAPPANSTVYSALGSSDSFDTVFADKNIQSGTYYFSCLGASIDPANSVSGSITT